MRKFVMDASVVLTWCFPDEESQKATEISEQIAEGSRIAVPAFWRHEILNALLVGEKRNRLTPELSLAFIKDLNQLPVDVDEEATSTIVFEVTQSLCRKHGLTAYDGAWPTLNSPCEAVTVSQQLTTICAVQRLLRACHFCSSTLRCEFCK